MFLIIIGLLLLIFAGTAKAFQDTAMKNGFAKSWDDRGRSWVQQWLGFTEWWNVRDSWRNKWHEGEKSKGEKFFGSSTIFVWLTDAWHYYQAVFLNCFAMGFFAIGIGVMLISKLWLAFSAFIFGWVLMRLSFQIVYSLLSKVKKNS